MVRFAVCLTLAACGRLGFDDIAGAIGSNSGDARGDATADSSVIVGDGGMLTGMVTFGETGTAMFANVTSDTYIFANQATTNFGTANVVTSTAGGNYRVGLLRFDLSAVPITEHVNSAHLLIDVTSSTAQLAYLYQMVESWSETSATWNDRDVGTAWADVGAGPPDSSSAELGVFDPGFGGMADINLNVGPTVVQGWIADPTTNQGIYFSSSNVDTWSFASHEAVPAANRPVLVLDLSP